jgi:hypothetical protein
MTTSAAVRAHGACATSSFESGGIVPWKGPSRQMGGVGEIRMTANDFENVERQVRARFGAPADAGTAKP